MTVRDRQLLRFVNGARTLALLSLSAAAVISRSWPALTALLVLAVVAVVAAVVGTTERRAWPGTLLWVAEAAAIGVLCALGEQTSLTLFAALAVPPLAAGIHRGIRGVGWSLGVEIAALAATALALGVSPDLDTAFTALSWSIAGLALGMIGNFVHAQQARDANPLAPYLYAQSLIRQLIDLSGGLSLGLDTASLGGAIVSAVRDELPASLMVLFVPRDQELTPLVSKAVDEGEDPDSLTLLAVDVWATGQPVVEGRRFAFPLVSEQRPVAVLAGSLSERVSPEQLDLEARLHQLTRHLTTSAVQLDTALLFAAFRDSATADERQRLSREIHDGVAQDIASLGYLVDALSAKATTPEQAEKFAMLRSRITAVVAEVRRSVITLRTSVAGSDSLGDALGSVARNLRDVSGIAIEVTIDERPTRLRPEVEAELFRITQEALNNAVKHSGANLIRVHCQVDAPLASISVTDNGRGLGHGRRDSYGMGIMRERAHLVGAELSVEEPEGGGLRVAVRIADEREKRERRARSARPTPQDAPPAADGSPQGGPETVPDGTDPTGHPGATPMTAPVTA